MPGVTTAYQTGIHGSRPANGAGCIMYSCTTHGKVYRDDGTTWIDFIVLPSAGMTNPMTTSGDTIYGGASGVPTRLAKGSDGQVLTLASGLPSWAAGGGGSLTYFDALLAADVSMNSTGTFFDGCSNSCAAGTWLVWYKILFSQAAAIREFSAKLWDGTTVWDESEWDAPNIGAGFGVGLVGGGIVTLGGTTTIKVSARASGTGVSMVRDVATIFGSGSSTHTPTRMWGLKVA